MSDILAALREGHAARKMTKVDLPEYPAIGELYFPPLTANDQAACMKGVKKGDEVAFLINWLMRMACDKDGKRLFDVPLADRAPLMAELQKIEARTLHRLSMEADSRISTEAAAECVALASSADDVRGVIAEALEVAELSKLSKAVLKVDPQVMAKAFSDMAAAVEAGVTVKNA